MTIDEAIYCMQSYLPSEEYTHCTECKYYGCNANGICKSSEAHQKAISIMRKYQKIEEIVKNTQQLCSYGSAFIDIREVIADGNDD